MAFGFAPYLLKDIEQIARENNPEFILDPAGGINLLNSQKAASVVNLSPANNGHKRTVQVKYQTRGTEQDVTDTISCDNVIVPVYDEVTVPLDITKQIGIYIPDATIAKYMDEASQTVAVGQPGTPFMREFLFSLTTKLNGLVQALDKQVLTKLYANAGTNAVAGTNTPVSINFPKNVTVAPVNNGLNKIITDFAKNGQKGRPQVVGAGLFWDYMAVQPAMGQNYAGYDSKIQAARLDFYPDLNVGSVFGDDDRVLVVAPNAIQPVNYLENRGFGAGQKGTSFFFTIDLPIQIGTEVLPITFDAQLKYIDCPTTLTEAYTGDTITATRGWALFVSKQMGVFQIPADAYAANDRLYGVNGTFLYDISNDCENCEA